jgi:hypothetical protein
MKAERKERELALAASKARPSVAFRSPRLSPSPSGGYVFTIDQSPLKFNSALSTSLCLSFVSLTTHFCMFLFLYSRFSLSLTQHHLMIMMPVATVLMSTGPRQRSHSLMCAREPRQRRTHPSNAHLLIFVLGRLLHPAAPPRQRSSPPLCPWSLPFQPTTATHHLHPSSRSPPHKLNWCHRNRT